MSSKKTDHLTRGKACFPVPAFFRRWFVRFREGKPLCRHSIRADLLQGFYGFGVLKKMMPVDSGQKLYRLIARSPGGRGKSSTNRMDHFAGWMKICPIFWLGMIIIFTKPWLSDVFSYKTFLCELTCYWPIVGHWSSKCSSISGWTIGLRELHQCWPFSPKKKGNEN